MSNLQHKMQYLDEIYENLTALGQQEENEEKKPSVFLARHKLTGHIVVKKYVEADRIAVYKKLSQIEDAHLEKIVEYAAYEEQGIVLMEYISGATLQELLQEKKTFSEKEVRDMAVELCSVLQKVHEAGIVHRDITPKNIMISNDGVLKLIDFGIAREKKEEKAQDTEILGTPGYAAPEQHGFIQTDKRSDIYAVGVLMNVALTGALPREKLYEGSSFRKIIQRCIEMDAVNRYQSVEELLADLYKSGQEYYVSKWLLGFRTGIVWKNVAAVIGYFLMILLTVISIQKCAQSLYTVLLETVAVFLYIWVPFMLITNIGYWDRKWFFAKMPRVVMIVIRIILVLVTFYNGVILDFYVWSDILGNGKK